MIAEGAGRMLGLPSRSGGWPTGEDDVDLLGHGEGYEAIDAKGTVVIGAGTEVRGKIRASGLVVWGAVVGDLDVTGHVEIVPGGTVVGTVAGRSLRVGDGGFLKARLVLKPA